jgi:hypothetical protein
VIGREEKDIGFLEEIRCLTMLIDGEPYQERGGDCFDRRRKEIKVTHLIRCLEKLASGSIGIRFHQAAA